MERDPELEEYIINHYPNLMNLKEKAALKQHQALVKSDEALAKTRKKISKMPGSSEEEVGELLDQGYAVFRKRVTDRILAQYKEHVFLNYCPNCGKLARTPQAKQCRHCGHDWH